MAPVTGQALGFPKSLVCVRPPKPGTFHLEDDPGGLRVISLHPWEAGATEPLFREETEAQRSVVTYPRLLI